MGIRFQSDNSEYVLLPNDASLQPAAVTLCAWLQYNDSNDATPNVWDWTDAAGLQNGYRWSLIEDAGGSDHHMEFEIGHGAGTHSCDADYSGNWSATVYHHVACTFETGDVCRIVVDGAAFATGGTGGDVIAYAGVAANGRIASRYDGNAACFWDGRIFDLRLYNRRLSLTEVQIIYEAKGTDNITNGLNLRLLMNEAPEPRRTKTVAFGLQAQIDISGQGNDGDPYPQGDAPDGPSYCAGPMKVLRSLQ